MACVGNVGVDRCDNRGRSDHFITLLLVRLRWLLNTSSNCSQVSPAAQVTTATAAAVDIHIAVLDMQPSTPHLQIFIALETLIQHSSGDPTVSI